MKSVFCRMLVLNATLVPFSVGAWCQITVDATHPFHERKRQATMGGGGGGGRKLPLRVGAELRGPSPNADGKVVLEFVLTNSGKTELAIPVSTSPGDFEPADARVGYTVQSLALRINSDQGQKMQMLSGGAVLYGSGEFPGSLVPLAPGESIHVLAEVVVPKILRPDERGRTVFVAYAGLNEETIKTVNGKTSLDMKEIGYANSQEYDAHILFGVPE